MTDKVSENVLYVFNNHHMYNIHIRIIRNCCRNSVKLQNISINAAGSVDLDLTDSSIVSYRTNLRRHASYHERSGNRNVLLRAADKSVFFCSFIFIFLIYILGKSVPSTQSEEDSERTRLPTHLVVTRI